MLYDLQCNSSRAGLHQSLTFSIGEQAKTLSVQKQAAFLDALFELVSPVEPAWEQAWTEECEDRAAAVDLGEMALFPAEEVMAKYRR